MSVLPYSARDPGVYAIPVTTPSGAFPIYAVGRDGKLLDMATATDASYGDVARRLWELVFADDKRHKRRQAA